MDERELTELREWIKWSLQMLDHITLHPNIDPYVRKKAMEAWATVAVLEQCYNTMVAAKAKDQTKLDL